MYELLDFNNREKVAQGVGKGWVYVLCKANVNHKDFLVSVGDNMGSVCEK